MGGGGYSSSWGSYARGRLQKEYEYTPYVGIASTKSSNKVKVTNIDQIGELIKKYITGKNDANITTLNPKFNENN